MRADDVGVPSAADINRLRPAERQRRLRMVRRGGGRFPVRLLLLPCGGQRHLLRNQRNVPIIAPCAVQHVGAYLRLQSRLLLRSSLLPCVFKFFYNKPVLSISI